MNRFRSFSNVIALLAMVCLLGAAEPSKRQSKWISAGDVDWISIVHAPPADGSPEQKQEIETLLALQKSRTDAEIERCKVVASGNGFYFKTVLGDWFNAKSLPLTAELLKQVNTDTNSVSEAAKRKWKRLRPYQADPRVKPCIDLETTTSYPSGHATRGIVWATVLAEIFPEHRAELLAKGKQFGDDRILSGVHYPSDITVAQTLGAEIARKLLANKEFKAALNAAKEECLQGAGSR